MIGCLPTQALAFLAVFVYANATHATHATHATQAIAFEWKPGLTVNIHTLTIFRKHQSGRRLSASRHILSSDAEFVFQMWLQVVNGELLLRKLLSNDSPHEI